MRLKQWAPVMMFMVGIALIVIGSGLLTWVSVQRRAHAGLIDSSTKLVNAFAKLFKTFGEFLGPEPAARAGGFLIAIGGGLDAAALFLVYRT